jgi:hypothetical protein
MRCDGRQGFGQSTALSVVTVAASFARWNIVLARRVCWLVWAGLGLACMAGDGGRQAHHGHLAMSTIVVQTPKMLGERLAKGT